VTLLFAADRGSWVACPATSLFEGRTRRFIFQWWPAFCSAWFWRWSCGCSIGA